MLKSMDAKGVLSPVLQVFRNRLGSMRKALKSRADIIFLDAPHRVRNRASTKASVARYPVTTMSSCLMQYPWLWPLIPGPVLTVTAFVVAMLTHLRRLSCHADALLWSPVRVPCCLWWSCAHTVVNGRTIRCQHSTAQCVLTLSLTNCADGSLLYVTDRRDLY